MEFGIIGTSVWQQNMPLLERLTVARDNKLDILEQLKSHLGVNEMIYLSTCNRVEVIYSTPKTTENGRRLHKLIDFFFQDSSDICFFPNDFYHFTGKEAITHLFRTTASLESLVIGETQITGQFKQAYQFAVDSGLAGPTLGSLAQEALVVARKVKRETSIGEGCLSMASLAAGALNSALKKKENPVIALVGSGAMTVKLAKHIRQSSNARFLFVNRTVENIEKLAKQYDGDVIALEEFLRSPRPVDAIASATAAAQPVFDSDFLARLNSKRKEIVCIDLAVPGDFARDCGDDPHVTLIDISRLKSQGQGNLRQKFVEASKANEIVRESVNKYLANRIEVSLKPIFQTSYRESVELAKQALEDLFSKRVTGLNSDQQEAVLRLVTKLISHSSFQPVRKLSDHLVEQRSELTLPNPASARKEAV